MALSQSNPSPRLIDGETALQRSNSFVSIRTQGARELAEELLRVAGGMARPKLLASICAKASKPIRDDYKRLVSQPFAAGSSGGTGNLAKSVRTVQKEYEGGLVGVAVTGPVSSGARGADPVQGAGNHAWLVEFGTGRRRPGTQNRRTYVNVHQMINGKMKRSGTMNDEEFASRSRGYYFLMGSINEPTRQGGAGKGYSHDFATGKNGETRPVTLGPGESIAPMPAYHPMENTINSNWRDVQTGLFAALQSEINKYI